MWVVECLNVRAERTARGYARPTISDLGITSVNCALPGPGTRPVLASTAGLRLRFAPFELMPTSAPHDIVPVLQVAIGPVILISGVGLLLLTMTNRLGRAIDRARLLKAELAKRADAEREQVLSQLAIIYRRARLIRLTIILAAVSVLLASVLVIVLFVTALLHWELGWFVASIFIACLVSLFASLVTFIGDINLSLHALKLELKGVTPGKE